MNNEVYTFALKNTLDEIKNACPDVSNTFIFKDGKILAKDETEDATITKTTDAFKDITQRADAIGGIEAITIHGTKGRLNIACMSDLYLTTVASNVADEKYVNTLTHVLIPTVIRLVEKINPESATEDCPSTINLEPNTDNDDSETEDCEKENSAEENTATEQEDQPEAEVEIEPLLPDPPVIQLMVENLGGLLVPSDTVRIDNAVITQWKDLYGEKKIEETDIETLNGKTTRCKFKPIKNSKQTGKGVIGIPEKIQLTLETSQGELIMVKPIVE